MISRERFNELKEQKKDIYYLDYSFGVCSMHKLDFSGKPHYGVWADHFPIPDEELEVRESCYIQSIDDCYDEFVCYLKDCYETQEDAEFAKEFKNVTAPVKLDLPSFEELQQIEKFEFKSADGYRYDIFYISGSNKLVLFGIFENKYTGEATKENYLEACKIAKKLFLGENSDGEEI